MQGLLTVMLAVCPVYGAAADSVHPRREQASDSLRLRADLLFARQEYRQAAEIYGRIVAADTVDSQAMVLLGSCLMRSGKPALLTIRIKGHYEACIFQDRLVGKGRLCAAHLAACLMLSSISDLNLHAF